MKHSTLLASVLALVGCSTSDTPLDPPVVTDVDPQPAALRITPGALTVTIVDGAPVVQAFTATMVADDGTERDVTSATTWSLADGGFGSVDGATLTLTGTGAGPTALVAMAGGLTATAPVTVHVRGTIVDDTAPSNAAEMFGRAVDTAGCAPSIAYPADQLIVPANLGRFDVQWRDPRNDLFAIAIHNTYVDLTIYTATNGSYAIADRWPAIASARAETSMQLTGLATSSPETKCASAPRRFGVTNEDALGGVYYWSSNGTMRHDLRRPGAAAETFQLEGGSCIGCHAVSRDGTRIAVTRDHANGRGAVLDLAEGRSMMPADATTRWNGATFTPDGDKLLTIQHGEMTLLAADGGAVLTTVENPAGTLAGSPELSPDGTRLAYVQTTGTSDWAYGDASIVIRSFDETTNTFGDAQVVLPFDDATGLQSYYPSWSPDGQWLAITRSTHGSSYANPDATIWVIKADGSLPPLPISTTTGFTESGATWLPTAHTLGRQQEPMFFLSFASTRAYGTTLANGMASQIWVAPFFPARATAGLSATGPAHHAPYQDVRANNHSPRWGAAIVGL